MTGESSDRGLSLQQDLTAKLGELRQRYEVPGIIVSAAHGDLMIEAAVGLANLETGAPMTPDTLFLIGSISKIYTTSLIMRLVELGKLDVDVPVRRYVPEFRVADPEITEIVTIRHFLTHSSGIDGADYCFDGGRGEDGIRRYVESCAELGRLHAPGELTSYCNPGFVVAGRAVELVMGQPFDHVQRDLLLGPLGTTSTCTLPEDAILRPVAAGHMPTLDGTHRLTRSWMYNAAAGPCGTVIAAPARDVVAMALMHIRRGEALNGARVLMAESVESMQSVQYRAAFGASRELDMGIGWMIGKIGSARTLGHGGGSPGGVAQLQVVPDYDFAVAVF